jgi:hypothetical protein
MWFSRPPRRLYGLAALLQPATLQGKTVASEEGTADAADFVPRFVFAIAAAAFSSASSCALAAFAALPDVGAGAAAAGASASTARPLAPFAAFALAGTVAAAPSTTATAGAPAALVVFAGAEALAPVFLRPVGLGAPEAEPFGRLRGQLMCRKRTRHRTTLPVAPNVANCSVSRGPASMSSSPNVDAP